MLHATGVDDLLQMILWVAEEKQLMANPKRRARGTVIEAHLDKKVGQQPQNFNLHIPCRLFNLMYCIVFQQKRERFSLQ